MNSHQKHDLNAQLAFSRQLQTITNLIHATHNVDEIMLDLSAEICQLFNADRLTIYALCEDKVSIVSKIKTGLGSFKDIRLPISDTSIAGYVAKSFHVLNIRDVYDEEELKTIDPSLQFLSDIDQRTGYRTKQQLVAPILEGAQLVGVLQIINTHSGESFSAIEEEGIRTLTQTLAIAMTQRRPTLKIASKYDTLVTDGVLTEEEYRLASQAARRKGEDIESILKNEFHIKIPAIGAALEAFFKVPYEPFRPNRIKPIELLKTLKRDFHEEHGWIPIEDNQGVLTVIAFDPERLQNTRTLQHIFPRARKIELRVTTHEDFAQTIEYFFGDGAQDKMGGSIDDFLSKLEPDENIEAIDDRTVANDNELVKFVNKIIVEAYRQGASDIHIEPYPGKQKTIVRFRKDGTLVPYIEVPAHYRQALVTRIKIMCDLDISEKRKPQDGKIKFKKYGPVDIELRVATIPSAGNLEDVVMRVLSAGDALPLEKLELSPANYERLLPLINKPYGLFFVCGPTGSGKTTTLHSILSYLNTSERKIWTAEDPIEITQKGLRQVQINRKAQLDFASAMRAFLRADPDIIMVGEMRDLETSEIAIEASLTGHLVFSTLHTNSAPESIVRLLDMGMDPFNFADALLGVLAQRLAKRLCSCKEAYQPDTAEIELLMNEYTDDLKLTSAWQQQPDAAHKALRKRLSGDSNAEEKWRLYRAKGCEKCDQTGYKGRIGLHELLTGSPNIKRKIQEHAPVSEVFNLALEEGMKTLKMDGIEKVLKGHTDMKQVRAVCIR